MQSIRWHFVCRACFPDDKHNVRATSTHIRNNVHNGNGSLKASDPYSWTYESHNHKTCTSSSSTRLAFGNHINLAFVVLARESLSVKSNQDIMAFIHMFRVEQWWTQFDKSFLIIMNYRESFWKLTEFLAIGRYAIEWQLRRIWFIGCLLFSTRKHDE